MSGVNKVILVGFLGQNPEVKRLQNASVVANFTLATSEPYKDRNGNKVQNTEWHDIELWEGLAKVAEAYLTKGSQVYIEGKIKTDQWEDEQGNKRKRTKIRVVNLVMLGGGESKPKSEPQQQYELGTSVEDDTPQELPF